MIAGLAQRCSLLLLGLTAPAVLAADPQALLTRMQRAAQGLDYDGVFVYQHGNQLDSLRIIHKATGPGTQERLISLNGVPREIIRTDREVHCYLPDENAVMIEHRRAGNRNFPALLPESLATLDKNYRIRHGKDGRVAGRKANLVVIKPRDGYRYGYQLWADAETGLLLKASLVNEQGAVFEQTMFTQVSIGQPIADEALKPQNPGRNFVWHKPEESGVEATPSGWEANRLPTGFSLSTRMTRKLPARREPVEHLVYSDGLAVVSVFIESAAKARKHAPVSGLTQFGAVHVYGKVVDDRQITVMGEAPAAAIDMIGDSVANRP